MRRSESLPLWPLGRVIDSVFHGTGMNGSETVVVVYRSGTGRETKTWGKGDMMK